MASMAAIAVKKLRAGYKASERCYTCGAWHDEADHFGDALHRFFWGDNVVNVFEDIILEGVTNCGSVVEFEDGSRAIHNDDGAHPRSVGVLRGRLLVKVLPQIMGSPSS